MNIHEWLSVICWWKEPFIGILQFQFTARILHNRDKFSTKVLSIQMPNNETEDHRQILIQWPSDDHFLWCCTIPAISKEWRHELHPKKVCAVIEEPDINGSLTCKEKKKQWLWSSKLLITWNIVNDRMYVTWDFRYQLL